MQEALSYKFIKDPLFEPQTLKHQGHASGSYYNNIGKPVVVVDFKGNIKEVILKGGRNVNRIAKNDKLILNGRRFEITDGEVQKG